MLLGGTEAPRHPALGCLGILGFITRLQACSGFMQPYASRRFGNPSSAGGCPAPQHPLPKRPQHPQILWAPAHPREPWTSQAQGLSPLLLHMGIPSPPWPVAHGAVLLCWAG